jgi:hypothetical protein
MSKNRYGKTSSSLIDIKSSFFEQDILHKEKHRNITQLYKQQPDRDYCKNCNHLLSKEPDFIKLDIGYVLCIKCSHLNGLYDDTEEFCNAIYSEDETVDYGDNYKQDNIKDYNHRTSVIYIPKAEFLYDSIKSNNDEPSSLNYLDFGAGSGYFLSALKTIGLNNIKGIETSSSQVELGNKMLGKKMITQNHIDDNTRLLAETDAEVISMIGVLEHLQNPREVIKTICANSHIKYLYISVPTFSLSVFLEINSSRAFHRQLTGGHTHLYTDQSINYLATEFGFNILNQWWFGTDIVDLYRHIYISLLESGSSKKMIDLWENDFRPVIDNLQIEIDKKHFSSEVHVLLEKK